MNETLPPNSPELERSLIACLLVDPGLIVEARASRIDSEWFYHLANQSIFSAIMELAANGEPVDCVTVTEKLKASGKLEQVGGFATLFAIGDTIPSAGNFRYYAEKLREVYGKRKLLAHIELVKTVSQGKQSFAEAMKWAGDSLKEISDSVEITPAVKLNLIDPLKASIIESLSRYEELLANRGKLGVMTGFSQFDEKSGGLKDGQMTVIAAESNGGKTTLALNILNAALQARHGVLLFTLEMDRDEIIDLLVSMNAEVDRNMFNTGFFTERDQSRIGVKLPNLSHLPLWIEDSPSANMAHIEQTTRSLAAAKAIKLVVIDYVQLISPHDEKDNREQQVAKISRAIRCLAKETKLPIIVLSQLNDEGKLRESRVIAHEAHNVILVEADPSEGKMLMRVVKGRKIPRGEYLLQYSPRFCRVEDKSGNQNTPTHNDP